MTTMFLSILFSNLGLVLLAKILPSKGKAGERRVAKILSKLPEEEYKVINNLLFSQNGRTTQIDHVVVSKYGIFVIETKFYNGWIYGGDNSEYWTQNIYGKKYQLWNPIHQNQGHIRALKKLLNKNSSNLFISIVAFSQQATLKIKGNGLVIYWNQLNNVIYSFHQEILSSEQVQKVYLALIDANIDSKENQKQHVRNVKAHIYRNQNAIANRRCPHCGGHLVLRNGKYGNFYGCSNYPRCKYTYN